MFWKWLLALPLAWQIILPIILIASVVIISIYGRVLVTAGKKSIGIGRKGSNKKRDCVECSKYHRAEAAKVNRKITRIESGITKNKMNFVEQKLLEIKREMYTKFADILKSSKTDDYGYTVGRCKDCDSGNYSSYKIMQYFKDRIEWILGDSVLDEIRRSIKENGFHERDGKELMDYMKQQHNTIMDIIEEDLLLYYDNDTILALSKAVDQKVLQVVQEIYMKSTEIELKALAEINKLEFDYDSSLDDYLNVK